jgi:hypothetical protein
MRKIFLILLLLPAFADAQLSSIVLRNDTLFSYNPSTNVWTQLTKTVPAKTGQSGKVLSNNGTDYTWITPDYAASNHTHTGVYQPADADLTTYAGITPSSNVQSLLGAADYAAVKSLLSLGNVTNTSDANKPVSTAQQTALDAKVTGGAVYLTSNFTTTNTTATNTNLTFSIAANEKFIVDIEGTCSKAISTTGLKFAIAAPAGCTISGVQYGGGATLVAPVPSVISAINTLGATLATGIGVTVPFRIHITVINSSTAGNITLQCASVTSNTATVYAGASMVYYKATGL